MVNLAGISFDHRMTEDSGASLADVGRAFVAARDIFGFTEIWREIDELGGAIDLETQIGVLLDARRMTERGTVWLLRHRRPPLDIGAAVDEFAAGLTFLGESLEDVVGGRVRDTVDRLRDARVLAGVPRRSRSAFGALAWLHTGFDIVEIAHSESVQRR